MSDALELRENRAWALQGRMYADAEKAGNGELTPPGKRVIHNPEFIGYFVWKVARIPYPFRSFPPPQDKIDFSSHYGEPLGLFEVTPFLEKLTGADYESGFDVAADEVAYTYLHNLIEKSLHDLNVIDLGTEAVAEGILIDNVAKARKWLKNHIKTEKRFARESRLAQYTERETARSGTSADTPSAVSPSTADVQPVEVSTSAITVTLVNEEETPKVGFPNLEATSVGPAKEVDEIDTDISPTLPRLPEEKEKLPHFSQPQLALYCFYTNIYMNRGKADELALKYGHGAKNSGKKLFEIYNAMAHNRRQRVGEDVESPRTMRKNINAVIPWLAADKRQKAEEDVSILTEMICEMDK